LHLQKRKDGLAILKSNSEEHTRILICFKYEL
jgi:hypothetical protein